MRAAGWRFRTVVRNRVAKLSISIDDDDLRWLRRHAARSHRGNISAAIAEATRRLRHNEALGAMLDAIGAPKFSDEELDAAAAEIEGRVAPRRGTSTKRRRRAA